ncbi:hypothetical protein F5887DRAFT_948901 [Amanita rubescens]|nr:hypothetical protein F5887DRAFT_948901 [Amanita rubescens]
MLERTVSSGPSTVSPADDPKPVIEAEAKIESKADADNAAAPVADPPLPSKQTPAQTGAGKSLVAVAKRSPSNTSKSPPRTNSKFSVPRHSSGAPVIQPIKPQHSGLSTASAASARKPTSPTRTAARSTATPGAITRPKTPSSGLFAPTAASLAKSRNAPASTPTTPVKKSTISASASDRLSKPTAASLSRARTPAPPLPQLTRSTTKPVAATRTTTKTASKAPTTSSVKRPSSVNKSTTPTEPATGDKGCDDNVAGLSEIVENQEQEPINGHALDMHSEDVITLEEASGQASKTSESEEREAEKISDDAMEDVGPESDADASMDFANEGALSSPSEVLPEPKVGIVSEEQASEQESKIDRGDDIESLVNLLESASIRKDRPVSIASIPDEVHEIPDEE